MRSEEGGRRQRKLGLGASNMGSQQELRNGSHCAPALPSHMNRVSSGTR